MGNSSDLNDEFDQELEQLLPDSISLETPFEETSSGSGGAPDTWQERLENWHTTHGISDERRQELAEREIERYSEALSLPTAVTRMAEQTFTQYAAKSNELIIELTVAGVIYSTAKLNGHPITPEDIVRSSQETVSRKILLRTSKEIVSELGLDPAAFFDASMYVERFCDELNLVPTVATRAEQILVYCSEAEISSGKSPTGFAAAAIYNAILEQDYSITQSEVSEVSEVTEVTIRNRYQEQREVINEVERPEDDVREIVEWAIERIKFQPTVESEIRSVLDSIDGNHETPTETGRILDDWEEEPLHWGMATVMVGAHQANYNLQYSTLKALSGLKSGELRPYVSRIKSVTPVA